ncbi:phosphate/phosphite/phosphonate ABC transporter substrate-binding protein [Microaerobacter geothermalis]|uniref:phosphate/phosphite/phosphonate ABC transporter substrate-binding protein n=1 Tax=Microaerobacter geothermalis TaxID=674972 RepID=UPI001F3E50BD|nr:phosphate/phosphite/phosphonate ABC transporter substrate-binding protein [Microaerobacter geothermalis]MCF6094302.1 phosphate/phosphite/phosphonate ABC transporter substrate-binding protein [Microaerobacter geothermalis]
MKKWSHSFLIIFLVGILSVLLLSGCSSKEGEPSFKIGVIPSQNQGKMQQAMDKLTEALEKGTGMDVSIEVYPDYNGVVEAMNNGMINMAYFGPLTYVIANAENGAQAIVTQLVDGEPFYYSYIITHKDAPYNSLEDLLADKENVTFAFGDINSTSGSLIPGIELKKRGVFKDANDHQFKNVFYTGGHDATAIAVENKQVTAGAIDSAIFNILIKNGKVDGDLFKVIWKSDKLFQYPWAVAKGTDQATIEKLQEAFLGITDPEILNAFGASGFIKASDSDYESIRQAAKADGRIK